MVVHKMMCMKTCFILLALLSFYAIDAEKLQNPHNSLTIIKDTITKTLRSTMLPQNGKTENGSLCHVIQSAVHDNKAITDENWKQMVRCLATALGSNLKGSTLTETYLLKELDVKLASRGGSFAKMTNIARSMRKCISSGKTLKSIAWHGQCVTAHSDDHARLLMYSNNEDGNLHNQDICWYVRYTVYNMDELTRKKWKEITQCLNRLAPTRVLKMSLKQSHPVKECKTIFKIDEASSRLANYEHSAWYQCLKSVKLHDGFQWNEKCKVENDQHVDQMHEYAKMLQLTGSHLTNPEHKLLHVSTVSLGDLQHSANKITTLTNTITEEVNSYKMPQHSGAGDNSRCSSTLSAMHHDEKMTGQEWDKVINCLKSKPSPIRMVTLFNTYLFIQFDIKLTSSGNTGITAESKALKQCILSGTTTNLMITVVPCLPMDSANVLRYHKSKHNHSLYSASKCILLRYTMYNMKNMNDKNWKESVDCINRVVPSRAFDVTLRKSHLIQQLKVQNTMSDSFHTSVDHHAQPWHTCLKLVKFATTIEYKEPCVTRVSEPSEENQLEICKFRPQPSKTTPKANLEHHYEEHADNRQYLPRHLKTLTNTITNTVRSYEVREYTSAFDKSLCWNVVSVRHGKESMTDQQWEKLTSCFENESPNTLKRITVSNSFLFKQLDIKLMKYTLHGGAQGQLIEFVSQCLQLSKTFNVHMWETPCLSAHGVDTTNVLRYNKFPQHQYIHGHPKCLLLRYNLYNLDETNKENWRELKSCLRRKTSESVLDITLKKTGKVEQCELTIAMNNEPSTWQKCLEEANITTDIQSRQLCVPKSQRLEFASGRDPQGYNFQDESGQCSYWWSYVFLAVCVTTTIMHLGALIYRCQRRKKLANSDRTWLIENETYNEKSKTPKKV